MVGGRASLNTTYLLNGKTYDGAIIKKGGDYELQVHVKDEVGNESTKKINFILNESPVLVKSFKDQTMNKFDEVRFDIYEYFQDYENDPLDVIFTNSNEESLSATLSGHILTLKALKQGTAEISIKVNDGYTDSEAATFNVGVETRVPEIKIKNNEWILIDDDTDLVLSGTVKDEDKEKVTVTGVLNNDIKTHVIEQTTGNNDEWQLNWSPSVISYGVHTSILSVKAEDEFTGVSNEIFNKAIVKVSGKKEDYIPIIELYEKDLKNKSNEWDSTIHSTLLNAYESIKKLLNDNSRSNQEDASKKVAALKNGELKTSYEDVIRNIALEWLQDNLNDATADDYNRAGIDGVKPDRLNEYQNAITDYGKSPLSLEDIQLVIDAVNAVQDARENPSTKNIAKAYEKTKILDESIIKDKLLNDLEKIAIDYVVSKGKNTNISDLEHGSLKNIDESYEKEYQKLLGDLSPKNKEEIQNVIDSVNRVMEAYKKFIELPNGKNLMQYILIVDTLPNGDYKAACQEEYPALTVVHIRYAPNEQDEDTLTWGDFDFTTTNISLYNRYLPEYIKALEPILITHQDVQTLIKAIDLYELAIKNPNAENISKALEAIENLQDGQIKDSFADNLIKDVLEKINQSINTVTAEDLQSIGIKDVQKTHESQYQEALKQYQEDLKRDLTPSDIQKVVDSINGILDMEKNLDTKTLKNASQAIHQLESGKLKEQLYERLKKAALDYIRNHESSFFQDKELLQGLLEAGFEQINPSYIDDYQEGIKGLHDSKGSVNLDDIQIVIDIVNGLHDTKKLKDAKDLKESIVQLPEGTWKEDKLKDVDTLIKKLTPSSSDPSSPINPEEDDSKAEEPNELIREIIEVIGKVNDNTTEFTIDKEKLNNPTEKEIILKEGNQLEIAIPVGAIDFDTLQQQLGKFGLIIQLIKIDDTNYKLIVKAVSPEGERELKNFQKHINVSMSDAKILKAASIAETVVLRKDGSDLTSVPHQYKNGTFIIKTTRTGHFIVTSQKKSFPDINKTFSKTDIEQLANRHIVYGGSNGYFYPNRSITRAELAVMIARAMDLQATRNTSFKDVKGKWYEDAVQAVYEAGIVQGKNKTTFAPNQYVTRQEAAAMMARALRFEKSSIAGPKSVTFMDVKSISSFALEDIALLSSLNIMTGNKKGYFNPNQQLTRAEMAKILNGTLKQIDFL